ncbi:MAG TPA: phage/plasmid primase, P4 family [Bryobacteraceae bacterium]|nr:phage/plasmid primase, P4 family [Bryobacteraceae bacterium]
MTALDAARDYLRRGWAPIPVPFRSKNPRRRGWQNLRLAETDLERHFNCRPQNIGVLLGEPSGWLVDVDIDNRRCAELAGEHLPPTAVFGRASKPRSHWLYQVTAPIKSTTHTSKTEGHLIQIRGTGMQTVFPPSTHESGEPITWEVEGAEPAEIDPEELLLAVEGLANRVLEELGERPPQRQTEKGRRSKAVAAIKKIDLPDHADGSEEGRRSKAVAAMKKIAHADHADGSRRLLLAARQVVRYDLSDAEGIEAIREYAREKPFPRAWTDEQIIARIRDAEKRVTRGEALNRGTEKKAATRGEAPNRGTRAVNEIHVAGESLTDLGNAERLVKLFGADLRYVPAWGKWLIYTGKRWEVDEIGQIHQRAKETVRRILADAANEPDDEARRRLVKFALACESDSRLRAMVARAQSEPGIPVTPAMLNADDWVLNVENGTLDLRTGELREHRREDLITRMAPVRYVEGQEHPVWSKLLSDATGGNREVAEFLQRAVGYSLTGSTAEEKLFFVHGPGAAGKSTFIEALKSALGDYAMTADFETFLDRPGAGGIRNDIARLDGARFVSSVEVSDGRQLAQGLVKMLTGGDTITARYLYQEAFQFLPRFKLWLAANHAPRADDTDDALWRRIVRIPFEHVVPKEQRDPRVKETLRNDPAARAAILAWAVQGCLTWQKEGLRVPECLEAATEAYRQDQDPLRDFFTERCVFGEGWVTRGSLLRTAYLQYAEDVGIRSPLHPRAFAERLKAKGCVLGHDRSGSYWAGIGLVPV